MKKVMVFGAFDILHRGHEHFLKEARKRGDFLIVNIGRDRTIERLKGKKPQNSEEKRLRSIKNLKIADKVILGSLEDPYKCLDEKPDIICLGYDQKFFIENLEKELKKRKLKTRVERLAPFHPEKYKSSLIRKSKT